MGRFQSLIVFEALLLGLLLALPVYWVRVSNLKRRDDEGLYWKLLLAALLFTLGAVSGLRVFEDGWANTDTDRTTFWFLPLMGAFYLHVRVTHQWKQTLEIGMFLMLVGIPVALARVKIGMFLFAIPD